MENMTCSKCNGSGKYLHYGVCYQCGGTGKNIHARGKQLFQVGDKLKKNNQNKIFEVIEVTKRYYKTNVYNQNNELITISKLGRHIDKYPEGSPEAYIKVN